MKSILYALLILTLPTTAWAQLPAGFVRHTSYIYTGNSKTPLTTSFVVEKDEYVYIEVSGDVYLGPFTGAADATGKPALAALRFNKYKDYYHGALVCRIGDRTTPCQEMFRFVDAVYDPVAGGTMNYLIDGSRMVRAQGINYIPGVHFLSPTTGPLTFELNDTDPDNNDGSFLITIYAIKKNAHFNRNTLNYCPVRMPPESETNEWKREATGFFYHHPDTFRGKGRYKGCQCAYFEDNAHTLDNSTSKKGTFDFGYFLSQDKTTADHLHVVLDMLPHELYGKRFPAEFYRPMPNANLTR
ncbi:hypothetical protein [Larkinella humicola]|uniref:DKNYY family protein n=1 Tax=Larkinella humicola TaxID=2607654 RepID=A0A5N1JBJ4_9BACT|nr:hypothetical protein [Larkinella humicola]KAA9349851.1 hypothetical protein F0P93_20635 [Larkinella humicola]